GRQHAVAEAALARAKELRDAAEADRQRASAALAALPPAVSPALPAAMTTERLEAWLADRERALETRAELRRARRERDAAKADAAAARATLAGALDAAAVRYPAEAGFEALLKLAGEA